MLPARVDNKIERLMRGAHKILKEWIEAAQVSNETKLVRIPVIVSKR